MQLGDEVIDVRIEDVGKKISGGYKIVPNSRTSIEKGSVTDVLSSAQGGSVVKRADGTPEDGEQGSAYYEGLITDAEDLISKGSLQAAGTEADRSFFNSLYTAAYDGINELLALKQIIAADPSLNPIPPGTPIETRASIILPMAFSSATSSKGLSLSKYLSTSAALSVSIPRSISSAARDTMPSGTLRTPDATPAAAALYQLTSFSSSAEINGINSAI